jgi:hypothetical protein
MAESAELAAAETAEPAGKVADPEASSAEAATAESAATKVAATESTTTEVAAAKPAAPMPTATASERISTDQCACHGDECRQRDDLARSDLVHVCCLSVEHARRPSVDRPGDCRGRLTVGEPCGRRLLGIAVAGGSLRRTARKPKPWRRDCILIMHPVMHPAQSEI